MKTFQQRQQELELALRAAVEEPSNQNLFNLIVTSAMVHRQGSGLVWSETQEIVDKVIPRK